MPDSQTPAAAFPRHPAPAGNLHDQESRENLRMMDDLTIDSHAADN